jgi:hypothetical protein
MTRARAEDSMSIQEFGEPPRPDQLEFTEEEILAEPGYEEPLFAGDVRCHGGFIGDRYVSPRTLGRWPAIRAWQRRLHDEGQPLIDVPRDCIPPHFPSCEQAKMLLLEGIRDPIVRSLTIISIVEGFGAMIREVPLPDLPGGIKEDIGGTALAHLGGGLFEAHARDEAGHRDQGGHKQMWEAARDLGLDRPEVPDDVLMRMMMGGRRRERVKLFPDLPKRMEALITAMANVMVIEIFAADVFAWGEQLLGDPEVSARPWEASEMVRHIRTDEAPHVEYLRTALSEIRARTLLTTDRSEIPGVVVIDRIFEQQLRGIASTRPQEQRERLRAEIRETLSERPEATKLIRRFEDLDSGWTFPRSEGERIDLLLV